MNKIDEQEIEYIVKTYSLGLYRFAYSYLRNFHDAEDVVYEVFLAVIDKRPIFAAEKSRKSWLFTVAANKCKNLLSSKSRHALVSIEAAVNCELDCLPKEDHDLLSYVLSLDEKYRVPIHLFYYEGYTINEIAKILRQKPATIGTWLSRGRKILKEMLGGKIDDQWL